MGARTSGTDCEQLIDRWLDKIMPAPVITATEATHRIEQDALPQFKGTGATGQIAWSVSLNHGVFGATPTNNNVFTTFTPLNQSESLIVTAKDLFDNAVSTVALAIEAMFPYQPDWKNAQRELDVKTNESTAEDGGLSTVEKSDPFRLWTFGFNDRDFDELTAAENFWLWHRKSKVFWLKDVPRGAATGTGPLWKVRHASSFKDDPQDADVHNYAGLFRQAIPF